MPNWWSVLEREQVEDIEEEWKMFESGVLESAEVCGIVDVGRKGKRSEWWDESLSVSIKGKKVVYGWRQNGSEK